MTAKEFFQRARAAEMDIRRLESMRDHYIAIGRKITPSIGAPAGRTASNSSKIERSVLGQLEAEIGIHDELEQYRAIVRDAENVIRRVRQERFRDILTRHYIAGMSLADVGVRLGYHNRNSIYRAHGWALAEAQIVLDRRETT